MILFFFEGPEIWASNVTPDLQVPMRNLVRTCCGFQFETKQNKAPPERYGCVEGTLFALGLRLTKFLSEEVGSPKFVAHPFR